MKSASPLAVKLFYNGVDLATLGTLRILSHTQQREPVEAPQRERVTYKVRVDFFEQSFVDNFGLIEQIRNALKTQNAVLLWQDNNGSSYIDRTVTAGEDESTDEALNRGGTYWQALVITFWFYNHDVVTNCLAATFQRSGGELLTFNTVEKFGQKINVTRYDELRDARKLVTGTVTASGRLQGDTTADLATRQTALQELKDTLESEFTAAESGVLAFGTFNRSVRVAEFNAEVDQPNNYIAWSLTATYTVFPDETDYALIDIKIQNREVLAEGIKTLTIAGKIGAPTEVLATARLNTLLAALTPTGYVTLVRDVTKPQQQTESDASKSADQGDGIVFTEIQFNIELRDTSSPACTFQRTGANTPVINMGTVDKFSNAFNSQLFNEMRPIQKRASGTITINGKWYVADSLSDADKQAALIARAQQFDEELQKGNTGTLNFVTLVVNQVVRVIDFIPQLNRLRNCIEWSLTVNFTRFPNEANYAVCEFRLGTKQDRLDGIVTKTLNGRIGAQSHTAAQAKLAVLRGLLIPAGYVLKTDSNEENRVSIQSDGAAVQDSFIEITINEEWQNQSGNVLSYKLRITDDDDVKSGWVKTTYAGTVQASGSTADAAFATAEAQAAVLGAGKFAFLLRTSVVEISNQVLTDMSVIVMVEFSYEYQTRGTKIYTEVVSELNADTFGQSIETVSGFIAAPTLALALATYTNDVRNVAAYSGGLLLNERTPTLSQQRLDDELNTLSSLDDRYAFSFQVLRAKNDSQLAISYTFETASNLQTLEKTTNIQGMVAASSEAVADAFLDTFLTGLNLGRRLNFTRTPHYQQGPAVSGDGPATVMVSLSFAENYVDILTGVVSGILESECSSEVIYSGNRLVEKGIPDGPPIIQKVGFTSAKRTVTARAVGTTETSCQAWVRTIRLALLSSDKTYEEPPKVTVVYKFLPQTAGVPVGDSDNVKLFEVNATFSELVLSLPFS